MLPDTHLILPPPPVQIEVPAVVPPQTTPALPPTPEQVQTADAVFSGSRDRTESHAVEALFGIWAGTMVLNDLAQEHLRQARKQEDDPPLPARPDSPRQ
jgi:hypothetical protein